MNDYCELYGDDRFEDWTFIVMDDGRLKVQCNGEYSLTLDEDSVKRLYVFLHEYVEEAGL